MFFLIEHEIGGEQNVGDLAVTKQCGNFDSLHEWADMHRWKSPPDGGT